MLKRIICLILAIIFYLLAIIGLAIPVVPQVPFFVAGTVFLAVGFKTVKNIILKNGFYNKHLKSTVDKNKILSKVFKEENQIMDKQKIYDYIENRNIWHEITEHEAVFSMRELNKIDVKYPEYDAKNLFVRDDKKKNYYLITVRGNKRVDLKKFKKDNNLRNLSFASEEELLDLMDLKPGSVSPFGLLNDKENKVKFYLDKTFTEGECIIGVHPNGNTATVWLKTEDLVSIIEENGNEVNIVELS